MPYDATMSSQAWLPVVDIAPYRDGNEHDRHRVAAEIDRACRDVGFLAISGHGIDPAVQQRMLACVDAFFALADDVKQRCTPMDKTHNRGYAGLGQEALAYSLGVDSPPDLFEAFNIGTEIPAGGHEDPYYADELDRFFVPNVWAPEVPGMREAFTAYFAECTRVADQFDRMFATALDVPVDFFTQRAGRAANLLRVNHYQRHDHHAAPLPGQMRMGAHTDYGICTILLADPVPGLQVHLDGVWRDVIPEPGTVLVNLGDLTAEWTNDRWRSTLHRVVPAPADTAGAFRRRSLAFFHEANYDTVVETIASCIDADHPVKYPPVVAGEHLMAKLMGPRSLTKTEAMQTATSNDLR
jgi:isopenicillin N synthase-like dioxygenase